MSDFHYKMQDLVGLLLTPLMDGQMPQPERIKRSLELLQKEQELLGHEDLVRMQSVLYTLAMKFLTSAELNQIKGRDIFFGCFA